MSTRGGAGLVAALAMLPGAAFGQPPELPEIGVSTQVVALQVVVSDDRGVATGDLTREDFEVREEGRLRPIVAFEAIDAALPRGAGEPEASAGLASVSRRQYVLLFDLSFSEPAGLVHAREAAIRFVEGLPAPDLVAVGTVSVGAGVNLLVNLTGDRRQLRRAIETLGVGRFEQRPDPLRLALDMGAESLFSREQLTGVASTASFDDEVRQQVRDAMVHFQQSQQREYAEKASAYLENLAGLGRALDWVSGRKDVILLSSGFDSVSLLGAEGAQQRESSDAVTQGRLWEVDSTTYFGSSQARGQLAQMVQAFAASHAVIHTVDVSGLAGPVDAADPLGMSRSGAGRETLAQIANASGGQAIRNTNDLAGALCGLAEGTRRFYAMAFEPADAGKPGQYRKIEVKVARRGLRVSHRRGYRVPDAAQAADPIARQLRAAEAIAKGLSGGDFEVRGKAVPYRDAGGRLSVPVTFELDSQGLFEGRRESVAELEVYGYAIADSGRVEDALVFRGRLDRTALAPEGEPVQVQTAFFATPGLRQLRFVVREAVSGRTGTRSLELEVPGFDAESAVLYPPLLMRSRDETNAISVASMRLQDASQPFRVGDRGFVPALVPELRAGRTQRVCVMYWPGGARYGAEAGFDLELRLVGESGEQPLAVELVQATEEPDGFRRYVLAASPGEQVPAGDYRLELRVADPQAGREARSSQAVSLR